MTAIILETRIAMRKRPRVPGVDRNASNVSNASRRETLQVRLGFRACSADS